MDHTEDLSARVLLKHILSTEPPRTPITRSASKAQSTTGTRRRGKDADSRTPQDILRRSQRHKMRESIIRKSLPASTRRTASVVLRKMGTPASASVLFSEGETPRHILRNILQTEPVKTPVVHKKATSEEPQLPSVNSSITSKRPSIELSALDLPDLTTGNVTTTAKGLSRKRPRQSFNVTAFEKRLKRGDDIEEGNEESVDDHSSLSLSSPTALDLKTPFVDVQIKNRGLQRRVLNRQRITEEDFGAAVKWRKMGDGEEGKEKSLGDYSSLSLSSSTSLNLKTPFVDVQTEKRGLQRRVPERQRVTEEEFGVAIKRKQTGDGGSLAPGKQLLSETTYIEGFTLGQSKLSEHDITTDIFNCNTALYAQPGAVASNFSAVATQDKITVMASQLQRQVKEMEAEQHNLEKEKAVYAFPFEEGVVMEPKNEKCVSQSEEDVHTAEFQEEDGKCTDGQSAAHPPPEEDPATRSQLEEENVSVDSQTEDDDGGVYSQPKQDATAVSRPEKKEVESDPQAEDEVGAKSETGEEALGVGEARYHSEEEQDTPDSSSEEEAVADSHPAESAADSQSEEEGITDYQSDQEDLSAISQSGENGVAESQPKNEHNGKEEELEQESEQLETDLEHISRRTRFSEGIYIMHVTEAGVDLAGWSNGKSKAHNSLEMGSHESSQPPTGVSDLPDSSAQGPKDDSHPVAKPDADKENSFTPLGVIHDIEENGYLSDALPAAAAAQDPAEEEEESETKRCHLKFPCKTPAFVRVKRNFFHTDPLASSCVPTQASGTKEPSPAAKPKQVRLRKRGPAKKEVSLPKSYLMGAFKHFAKMGVSADVYPVLKEVMGHFFKRVAEDLETYANHAKRKTIEVEDVELLLKRQGYVNDKVPVEVLIEKYLRMEQRKLLIPIATSGNVVFPKKRK
uniref:centromere protein T n=1 Tax=Monopterus albus TaxID=43700 RepID=UPI0009B34478|nr:centromere protein T [Monopterus albus]